MKNLLFIFFSFLIISIFSEEIFVPESIKGNVVYYNDFEKTDGKAKINQWNLKENLNPSHIDEGLFGKGYLSSSNWKDGVILEGKTLSPHNPITISLWWALKEDHKEGGSFGIFCFHGKGMISCFVKGGGEDNWCALKKPAGIFQVYYFGNGMENVNGIYHFDIMSALDLKSKKWHNTICKISNGTEIELYHDGKKFGKWTLTRQLNENDEISKLSFGFEWGEEIYLDEIIIFDRILQQSEIEEYYNMVDGMRMFKR